MTLDRPAILLIAVGGTIATTLDASGYSVVARSGADIAESLTDAASHVDLTIRDFLTVPSTSIAPSDMCALAHLADEGIADGYEGVVITHGTDTLEETAYSLALQLRVPVPVVLTGAMRVTSSPGADGPGNLRAALDVARTPRAATLGPVVVLHDEIHLARWVTKVHTSRVAAFGSPGFGPVGVVSEGRVHVGVASRPADYLGLPDEIGVRVELIAVAAGTDGLLVEAAAAGGADAIVVAGTGGGHVPPAMSESLARIVESGIPVVMASRTGAGPLLENTYDGKGLDRHLREVGVISAGMLSPPKARLRLIIGLALRAKASELFPVTD